VQTFRQWDKSLAGRYFHGQLHPYWDGRADQIKKNGLGSNFGQLFVIRIYFSNNPHASRGTTKHETPMGKGHKKKP
jgi:hypothetical protein